MSARTNDINANPFAERLVELKRSFDLSFAEAPVPPSLVSEKFLAVSLGSDSLAIPLREVGGVFRKVKVVPVPGATPPFLGFAGIQGKPVPVYSTEALLGHRRAEPVATAAWLVLCGGVEKFGLVFDGLEGQRQPTPDQVFGNTLREGEKTYQIIDVNSLIKKIGKDES